MTEYKIQRRLSLSQEVDGIWSGLEEEEDSIVPQKVTMNECHMLRRVLGDGKSEILPKACKMMNAGQNRTFVSRLTHFADSPDVAGKVNLSECKQLSMGLRSVAGGATFLPMSCSAMLKRDAELEKERMEERNARLQRRPTFFEQQDFPPTQC